MSIWAIAALAITVALGVCGAILVRADIATRLVVLQFASAVASIDALAIGQSFGNAAIFDVALAIALLSLPSGLLYAKFYGRWL